MNTTNVPVGKSNQVRKGCNCNTQRQRAKNKSGCLTITTPVKTPDLAIYSQSEQFSLNLIPSWNNPDITTNLVSPLKLLPEAHITVRNISSVPASNALVHIYTSPFGIGTDKTLQLSQKINIGGGQQTELLFPFSQATLQGDQKIGIHISLEHPFDTKLINNEGSQVIDATHSSKEGRVQTRSIPVVNNSALSQEIHLQVLPTDINVSVSPSSKLFAPFEQISSAISINVPATLVGTPAGVINREITIVGRLSNGTIIGGTTILLYIDN